MNSQKIFPFELVNHSVESLHAEHHTTSRIIYLFVLGMLLSGFALLPIIKVDISTQSRGIIQSELDNNALTTGMYGQVEAIYIQDNQEVRQGDTLLVLSTQKLEEQLRYNTAQKQEYKDYIKDLNNLIQSLSSTPFVQTPLYKQAYLQYHQQIVEYQLNENYAQKELELAHRLFEAGSLSKVALEQRQFDLELKQNATKVFQEQQIKGWEIERQKYRTQLQALKTEHTQMNREREQYVVTAPITGTIVQNSGIQAGNFVGASQTIAQISATTDLVVESYVSPSDIGLIKKGMPVKFQVDAFNYNQWGLATGEVVDISGDIISIQNQPFFMIKCQLDDTKLSLKSGYEGNFKKGMTLTARYAIAERTLFQLLHDKMDDWLNPKLS